MTNRAVSLLPLLVFLLIRPPSAHATSAIFGGGPFYSGGVTTMNALRASGYTTVILWCIHVDAATGNLIYNDVLVASNGVYVGNAAWPAQLASLKTPPTSVNRLEISVSSWGVNDFQSIQTLMNNYGTNTDSILYRNFLALKNATKADAVDFDDETLYDTPTAVKFGQMLANMGFKVTLCPYTRSSFWQNVYNQLGTNIVDAVYLQCYSGGAGNNPATWNNYFPGTTVQPGMWGVAVDGAGATAAQVGAQMSAWRGSAGITGGFMWLYDNIASNPGAGGSPADYAQAINRALDPLGVTPSSGFTGVAAYQQQALPATTPFTLTNTGTAAINWSLINTSSWLTVSSSSGTLGAGAAAAVNVSLDTTLATNLAPGVYTANLVFSNRTTAVGLARAFTLNTAVQNWPVALAGFNATILAANTATASAPGATGFDLPNNYCFYQQGLAGGARGLPLTGVFASQCDSATAFQLGPYGAPDALMMGGTYARSGTLTLAAPEPFSSLAILAASANGGGQGTFVVHFSDGSQSPVFAFNAQDWFYVVTNVAIQGMGRLRLGSSWSIEDNGAANPNLYQTTVNLAALGLTQPVVSITFTNPAAANSTAVFAVSGLALNLPVQTPSGLMAIPGTNATASLAWNLTQGAESYHVWQATNSGGPFTLIGNPLANSFTAANLANGTTYYFTVSAVGLSDESAKAAPVSAMPGSYKGWVLAANPVAYWPLNESAGTVANELVRGSNGVFSGAYSLVTGGMAGAGFDNPHRVVTFSGAGWTQIPRLIGETNFSIVFWVRTSATGGTANWYNGQGLVDGEVSGTTGDFGVTLVGSKVGFGIGNPDTTLTSVKAINNGVWHQVAVTREAGNGAMKIYIDGVLDSSMTGPAGARTNPPALRIGSLQTGASGCFLSGSMSDVAFYSQALTASQVATLYSAATGLFYDVTLAGKWSGSLLTLSWPGNGKLLQATNLAGPWTTNAAGSPVNVLPNQAQMFYRVQTQ